MFPSSSRLQSLHSWLRPAGARQATKLQDGVAEMPARERIKYVHQEGSNLTSVVNRIEFWVFWSNTRLSQDRLKILPLFWCVFPLPFWLPSSLHVVVAYLFPKTKKETDVPRGPRLYNPIFSFVWFKTHIKEWSITGFLISCCIIYTTLFPSHAQKTTAVVSLKFSLDAASLHLELFLFWRFFSLKERNL